MQYGDIFDTGSKVIHLHILLIIFVNCPACFKFKFLHIAPLMLKCKVEKKRPKYTIVDSISQHQQDQNTVHQRQQRSEKKLSKPKMDKYFIASLKNVPEES